MLARVAVQELQQLGTETASERLVCQGVARGRSTLNVEDGFRDPVSGELLLSRWGGVGDHRLAVGGHLVFATLIRASQQWNRVSVNDLERQQLRALRVDLKLDPPPSTTKKTARKRRTGRAP